MPSRINIFQSQIIEEKEVLSRFLWFTIINVYPKSIKKLDRLDDGIIVKNKT